MLEYQRYKEVSASLNSLFEERQNSYTVPVSEETQQWIKTVKEEEFKGNPYDLIKAMNKVMRRMVLHQPLQTTMKVKEMSVDERIEMIETRLKGFKGKMSFTQLCNDCKNKHMFIVTFMAILDLVKYGRISYTLDEDEEIWIVKGEIDE